MRVQPGFDIVAGGGKAAEVRLLRQIADGGAGARRTLTAVGFHQPCSDFQKRRFARAVASDQRDALTGRDGQFRAGEKRRAAKGERDVFELKKWRSH